MISAIRKPSADGGEKTTGGNKMDNKAKKSVVVVRSEVAARLKKYCTENGLKIQYAAEQAVAEWLQKQMKQK
jgi:hypothetical protein